MNELKEFNHSDVVKQAKWELELEIFEAAVAREKEKLRNQKKHWFPWRLSIINVNKEAK